MCRHVSMWGFQNRVFLSVHLSVPREKKSPWLRQYQSYSSNWYINGMDFTSTTPWKPKNLKNKNSSNFDLCWIAEITLASSISVVHWQLIHQLKGLHEYYSMETQNLEKVRNSNFDLYFDLCWLAEITLASSISVVHWQLIHQWKGLHEYYTMET